MLAGRSFGLLVLWPLVLIKGLVDTCMHTVFEEPLDYRARKQTAIGQSPIMSASNSNDLLDAARFLQAHGASNSSHVRVL